MSTQHSPMHRKNILFVTRPLSPPWDEASKNFAFDLACHAQKNNVTILVDKIVPNVPEHIHQKRIYSSNHFSLYQKIRLVIFLLFHAKSYDIIHLLFTPTKTNSRILRFILRRGTYDIFQTIATVRDDLYTKKELHEIYFGNTLITYSQWAQKKLIQCNFSHVHHIYPGINLAKFTPQQKDHHLLAQWHLSDAHIIVTYPGEFARLGATDLIIDAFLDIWSDPAYDHIRYLCACRIKNAADAEKKQEVLKRCTDAGHSDKIIFTDTYANMNAIYNLSDMIIFPVTSMAGKFDVPLAMIEPYACKKPVIASDLPLFAEFSDPQINAIIPTANHHALVQAIKNLAYDPEKRTSLGENAYQFAHRTFNITTVAENYEHIYK